MWLFNRQSHYQCVFYFKSEKYIGSYNSQSDPTIYDPNYVQWSYIGSWFWQPWVWLRQGNQAWAVDIQQALGYFWEGGSKRPYISISLSIHFLLDPNS